MRVALFCTLAAIVAGPLVSLASAGSVSTNSSVTAASTDSAPLSIADYLELTYVADPQVSPDGQYVAYLYETVDKMSDSFQRSLRVISNSRSEPLSLGPAGLARWSPDGTRLAVLAPDEKGRMQLFDQPMHPKGPRVQLTRGEESPAALVWSPDGQSIAFKRLVRDTGEDWQIGMPEPPAGAKWNAPARVITKLHYRHNAQGFNPKGFTHLFVVPAEGGGERQITRGEWSVGADLLALRRLGVGGTFDWSRDGRRIFFDGLVDGDLDTQNESSNVYAVDVSSGAVQRITPGAGFWALPRVSPDGRYLAYVGHPPATRIFTYRAQSIWISQIDGRQPRVLRVEGPGDIGELAWAPASHEVYFTMNRAGRQQLYAGKVDGAVRALTNEDAQLTLASVSGEAQVAGVMSSRNSPSDVYRLDLRHRGVVERLTAHNEALLHRRRLGTVQAISFRSSGDTSVQGWLVLPPGFDRARTYPLVLLIHGGPHWNFGVGFDFLYHYLAGKGYVVLLTNPRGSTGFGRAFTEAIHNNYPGHADFDDLMAGVDYVTSQGFVDGKRLFVGGCSGGGTLTAWVVGHTDRFKAAAVLCPITNWISFVGTTDIPLWARGLFDKPFWDDPQTWLEHSPLMYVRNVKTPTLLATGDLDLRTPIGQAEEFYSALKTLGVPARLVRLTNGTHMSSIPTNDMRMTLYMEEWFKEWDPGERQ